MSEGSLKTLSVNALAAIQVDDLIAHQDALRLGVTNPSEGLYLVDAGVVARGGLEAGRRIAEICMGGLGQVSFVMTESVWPMNVQVVSSHPVLSCLASQLAGWSLKSEDGAYRCLGSGPGRSLALKEELFKELSYQDPDSSRGATIVVEAGSLPPLSLCEKIRSECKVKKLTIIITPTASLAGGMQVVSRVLEVALHKAHALKFPLEAIVDGAGRAPIPPCVPDMLLAMGRTNDAILFGGLVHLTVDCSDEAAQSLAQDLPAEKSRDFGRPFAEVFSAVKGDFYEIDPMLFAPAQVVVSNVKSGRTYRGGNLHAELLRTSFEKVKQ